MLDQRIEIMKNLEVTNIKIPSKQQRVAKPVLAPSQIHIKNTLGVSAMEKYTKSFIPLKQSATTARMSMVVRKPTLYHNHSGATGVKQQKTISAESGRTEGSVKKPPQAEMSREEAHRLKLL